MNLIERATGALRHYAKYDSDGNDGQRTMRLVAELEACEVVECSVNRASLHTVPGKSTGHDYKPATLIIHAAQTGDKP